MGPCIHTAQCILYSLCNHALCRPTHLWAPPLQDMLSTLLDVCPTLQLVSALVCVYWEWNKDVWKPRQWAFWRPSLLCWATVRCYLSHWWTLLLLAVAVVLLMWVYAWLYTQMYKRKLSEEIEFIPLHICMCKCFHLLVHNVRCWWCWKPWLMQVC